MRTPHVDNRCQICRKDVARYKWGCTIILLATFAKYLRFMRKTMVGSSLRKDISSATSPGSRVGDVGALVRIARGLPVQSKDSAEHQRQMVAAFCRLVGARFSAPPPDPTIGLSPRQKQTLDRMLLGDSEKQVAAHLKVSPHTVHVYIKTLYRHYDVCSRGELLAKFVKPRV
jgi:DNA-binding CsgD family transcriptional regulator